MTATAKTISRYFILKTAIKRKDAKHAEEYKEKYREMTLNRLVIFIFALSL
jgi:hypothetical protein